MTPHAWDELIDDVARDMTAADPASDFRARVMERVSAAPSPRRLAPFAWATALAAVAIAAIAFSAVRPFRSVEPERAVASVATPVPPTGASEDPVTSAEPASPVAFSRRASAPQPPAALVEWRSRRVPALEALAALDLDQIQPAGLSISQLTVTPLDIAPIAIPSIGQSESGGR